MSRRAVEVVSASGIVVTLPAGAVVVFDDADPSRCWVHLEVSGEEGVTLRRQLMRAETLDRLVPAQRGVA